MELSVSDDSYGSDHPADEMFRIDGVRVRSDVFRAVMMMLAPH